MNVGLSSDEDRGKGPKPKAKVSQNVKNAAMQNRIAQLKNSVRSLEQIPLKKGRYTVDQLKAGADGVVKGEFSSQEMLERMKQNKQQYKYQSAYERALGKMQIYDKH